MEQRRRSPRTIEAPQQDIWFRQYLRLEQLLEPCARICPCGGYFSLGADLDWRRVPVCACPDRLRRVFLALQQVRIISHR